MRHETQTKPASKTTVSNAIICTVHNASATIATTRSMQVTCSFYYASAYVSAKKIAAERLQRLSICYTYETILTEAILAYEL